MTTQKTSKKACARRGSLLHNGPMWNQTLDLPRDFEVKISPDCNHVLSALRQLADADAPEGCLLLANAQQHIMLIDGNPWADHPMDVHAGLLLRPDYPRTQALELSLVATHALGASLAELVIPMVGLVYRWPDTVLLAGGVVAKVELDLGPGSPPEWLGLGLHVAIAAQEPRVNMAGASLQLEGGSEANGVQLIELFCRQFLSFINRWATHGLPSVHRVWQLRGQPRGASIQLYSNNRDFAGVIEDYPEDGSIALRLPDNGVKILTLSEYFGTC